MLDIRKEDKISTANIYRNNSKVVTQREGGLEIKIGRTTVANQE